MILTNVRNIPDLRLNLLSTGKFDENKYTSSNSKGCLNLTKELLLIIKK